MTPKIKKIIIAIVVLGILFVVYAVFIKSDPVDKALIEGRKPVSKSIGQEDASALANQISQALLRIEQISLDKTIFNDAIYTSLKDRSKPIADEPIGRANPFAPLGDISSVKSTVRATSTINGGTATTTAKTTTPNTVGTSTPAGTASN